MNDTMNQPLENKAESAFGIRDFFMKANLSVLTPNNLEIPSNVTTVTNGGENKQLFKVPPSISKQQNI